VSSVSRVSFAFLVAAFIVTASGCKGDEYPKCESDSNCKSKTVKGKDGDEKEVKIDEFCVFGKCQECAKDTHCDSGEKCKKGRCEAECVDDGQCGEGRICQASACKAAECSPTKGCAEGKTCQAGRCNTPSSSGMGTGGGQTPVAGAGCEKNVRVTFDFNVYDLRPEARETLDRFAQCMRDNASWKLTVEGHADDRGTTEYNLQLGEKRASSIRDYLIKLGVDKARVKSLSFGEERPLQPGQDESSWAANRRGELVAQ
jgi:peptidoglycan-associated lipoprotein